MLSGATRGANLVDALVGCGTLSTIEFKCAMGARASRAAEIESAVRNERNETVRKKEDKVDKN